MGTEVARRTATLARPELPALRDAFLAGRSESTRRAYGSDLETFCRFVGVADVNAAGALLLSGDHGQANGLALQWRAAMQDGGLSPATINRRLASLRSMVKFARTIGLVSWSLEVGNVRSQKYRDTRGPGPDAVARMIRFLRERTDRKGVRDHALVRLIADLGLRRVELSRLDVADVDVDGASIAVLGKGRAEKERLTLPPQTVEALTAWLAVRGSEPGPLFTNVDPAGKGDRLTGKSVCRVVASVGRRVGVTVTPHGLRHAAITLALDLTGGDVRAVQRFSRHRDVRTLMIYDDNRADVGGEIAGRVAAAVG